MDVYEKGAIKEAFARTKDDIFMLGNEIYSIKNNILDLKNSISAINESINSMKIELLQSKSRDFIIPNRQISSNIPTHIPAQDIKIPTYPAIPSNNSTVPVEIGGLKYPNFDISSGNRGVPTDKPTNQQTDVSEDISSYLLHLNAPAISVDKSPEVPAVKEQIVPKPVQKSIQIPVKFAPEMLPKEPEKPLQQHIREAEDMLDSLDALKKEIRLKFKQITGQEMLVFSSIYQLEESFPEGVEYRQIAVKLKLSESSIRDYVQKLVSKGIPVDKVKLNNKKILLKISPKLKNLAPLQTLIKLREL